MGKNSGMRRKEKLQKQKKRVQQNEQRAVAGSSLLDRARKRYVQTWKITSSYFNSEGHYDWMAQQVVGFGRVLEVGCGNGFSTVALLEAGHSVVAVDENPYFLDEVCALTKDKGFSVVVVKRGRVSDELTAGHYTIDYSKVSAVDAQAILIEGDILDDPNLMEWLGQLNPFDAVVCWLFGTHEYRGANKCPALANIGDSSANRLVTQNRVYEVADEVLRPGGVLNIIDRTQFPDSADLINDLLRSHGEQASVTSLVVGTTCEAREYTEPTAAHATKMIMRVRNPSSVVNLKRLALTSITATKP